MIHLTSIWYLNLAFKLTILFSVILDLNVIIIKNNVVNKKIIKTTTKAWFDPNNWDKNKILKVLNTYNKNIALINFLNLLNNKFINIEIK